MNKELVAIRLNPSTLGLVGSVMKRYSINRSVAIDLLINASIMCADLDSYYNEVYVHTIKHGNSKS